MTAALSHLYRNCIFFLYDFWIFVSPKAVFQGAAEKRESKLKVSAVSWTFNYTPNLNEGKPGWWSITGLILSTLLQKLKILMGLPPMLLIKEKGLPRLAEKCIVCSLLSPKHLACLWDGHQSLCANDHTESDATGRERGDVQTPGHSLFTFSAQQWVPKISLQVWLPTE